MIREELIRTLRIIALTSSFPFENIFLIETRGLGSRRGEVN